MGKLIIDELPVDSSIGWNEYHYTSDVTGPVLPFTDCGSPTSGNWKIIIDEGVVITGPINNHAVINVAFPGWFWLINNGSLLGVGGAGGIGSASVAGSGKGPAQGHRAGGGGGAGAPGGVGGECDGSGTDAGDGTATEGGAGGTGSPTTAHEHDIVVSEMGGGGILLSGPSPARYPVILENNGLIWCGGGGGSYAATNDATGGAGGGLGERGGTDSTGIYYGSEGGRALLSFGKITFLRGNWEPPFVYGLVQKTEAWYELLSGPGYNYFYR